MILLRKIKSKMMIRICKCLMVFSLLLVITVCCTEPQNGIKVVQEQKIYPVLKNKPTNQLLLLDIVLEDTLNPVTLKEIKINAKGTSDISDLVSATIFQVAQANDKPKTTSKVFSTIEAPSTEMVFNGNMVLDKKHNYFWLSCELNQEATILNRIQAFCESITTEDGVVKAEVLKDPKQLRMGVAVRKHMDDSVHTYRIPGMVRANDGTLIACYDVRRESGRDLQGNMDIGISRSLDEGNTWEPMQIAMDMGTYGGLPEKFNGVSDACLLVDRKSGDIYLAGLWMHGVINKDGQWVEGLTKESEQWNHQWKNKGSQPGFGLKQTSQFLISKSSDNGKTWGDPVNITKMCKKEKWWLFAPAPGNGITMEDGTLVFPTQGRDENGEPFSNITYSKDGGKTWVTSNPAYNNTTECAVAELESGVLMLNMRDNRNREDKSETNGRAVFVTSDLGVNWKEHSSSHKLLPEPVCMASLFKFEANDRSILLFSNPNTKSGRFNITLKASFDNGKSWDKQHQILLDQGRGRGYSSITQIDESHVGILYESSQADMTFQKIPLSDLINK